jgi:hypothetical protein
MTNYTLKIDQANATLNTTLVSIDIASLNVVNYAAREALKTLTDSEHEVSVYLAEVSEANAPGRQLLQITADGETVADILKTRLAKVRKAGRQDGDRGERETAASYDNSGDANVPGMFEPSSENNE